MNNNLNHLLVGENNDNGPSLWLMLACSVVSRLVKTDFLRQTKYNYPVDTEFRKSFCYLGLCYSGDQPTKSLLLLCRFVQTIKI